MTATLARIMAACYYHGDSAEHGEHGCCECFAENDMGTCLVCTAEWLGPQNDPIPYDPSCVSHGRPYRPADCGFCAYALLWAWLRGWRGPTGHLSEDCTHCTVCDKCMGTGEVCRHCHRCPDHPHHPDTAPVTDCMQFRYDRFARAQRIFYAHSHYDKTTGEWSE